MNRHENKNVNNDSIRLFAATLVFGLATFAAINKSKNPQTPKSNKMKKGKIIIKDAKGGYTVQVIAPNGEPLSCSEILRSDKAVITNIGGQIKVFGYVVYGKAPIHTINQLISAKAIKVVYLHGENNKQSMRSYFPKTK